MLKTETFTEAFSDFFQILKTTGDLWQIETLDGNQGLHFRLSHRCRQLPIQKRGTAALLISPG